MLLLLLGQAASAGEWEESIARAQAAARAAGKPLFVYVYDSAGHNRCRVLEDEPRKHPRFDRLAALFVLARIDSRGGTVAAARELGADAGVAWVLLFGPHGNEIARIKGPARFSAFLHEMERVLAEMQRSGTHLLDYALTFGPVGAEMRAEIERLVAELGAPHAAQRNGAVQALVRLGEPAFRVLGSLEPADPEVRQSIRTIRQRLRGQRDAVIRSGLYRDVDALARVGPAALGRLRRILPPDAPRDGVSAWWGRHGADYRWVPGSDRFVRWQPWRGLPLRFRERDFVEIARSEDLADLGKSFTVEMWVRWPVRQSGVQYLLGDEAWPGMHAGVSVDVNSGWVLRRFTQNGLGRFNVVMGKRPSEWTPLVSNYVKVTDEWEHVALAKSRDWVRIFLNGMRVAEKRCAGMRFNTSPTPLYLGARRFAHDDRNTEQDLRAFRLSRGARYTEEFDPPQEFTEDDTTLVLLDFSGDNDAHLRDLGGGDHHGSASGTRWIRALDPERVADTLRQIGVTGGPITVFEAERGSFHGGWRTTDHDLFSEGQGAFIFTNEEPDDEGHTVTLRFTVARPGRYRIFFAGDGLHKLPVGVSAFTWSVGGGEVHLASTERPTLLGIPGASGLSLLGTLELTEGEHGFRLRLTGRRTEAPKGYALWFDALILQHLG